MKKQTLSILLALVLLLSISIFPVFAQELSEDEVSGYFGAIEDWTTQDLALAGVDSEAVDMTEFEAKSVENPAPTAELTDEVTVEGEKGVDLQAKSIIDSITSLSGEYVACGDGKVKIVIGLNRTDDDATTGTPNMIFVKSVIVKINGIDYELQNCKSQYGDACSKVYLDASGNAVLTGYVEIPDILNASTIPLTSATINYSKTPHGALETPITRTDPEDVATRIKDLCATEGVDVVTTKGIYEQCGGKASFKADIEVPATDGPDCLVPAQIYVEGTSYSNYTCRYTRFGSEGYPFGGDYCTPGKAIPVKPGDKIRFEAIINDLTNPVAETSGGADLDVNWRFGYNPIMITGVMESIPGPAGLCDAKIVPLKPLDWMEDADNPIEPSGWYNTYDKAVVGLYQKCGKFAVMQVRLRNDGAKTGFINLPGSVAVNGGAPIAFYWLSSVAPHGNKVALGPGEIVTLVGRIWLTNLISQTNSDGAANVAVNFSDLGLYMTGSLFSDRVNWRCY
ncbi:MAG TPA: hypothetical protein PLQ28_05705 [Flexilinea sp.]|nr:hypothetical protein [Flexilinea sp.]